MQALILAGGLGTRLRPYTNTVPKPMMLIEGKPLLEYQIEILKDEGLRDIILCIGYLGEKIEEYFKDGSDFGVNITYSKEDTPLDTGGPIKNAEPLINDKFIVMNGDALIHFHLEDLFSDERDAIILSEPLEYSEDVETEGLIELGEDNKVVGFLEKQHNISHESTYHVNSGVYFFRKNILQFFPEGKVSLEKEVFPILVEKGLLYCVEKKINFFDIGTVERYEHVKEDFSKIKQELGI